MWKQFCSCAFATARTLRFAPVCLLATVALAGSPMRAQTIEDGIMLSSRPLSATSAYTHDSWDHYWEGGLSRSNGTLGTVTTQAATWTANYALTQRLNEIGSVPYIWTHASRGVLHGQSGFQDLTLAAKYNLIQRPVGPFGSVRLLGVVAGSVPLTCYTPDLLPLSLGNHSTTLTGRGTLNYQGARWLHVNATAAYTWRGNVRLDRSSYYTNGQLYLSNQVALPNVFDYQLMVGYRRHDRMLVGTFEQQQTRGGGDIRRQDLPFVSNRVNASRAGAVLMYPLPRWHALNYRLTYSNTFEGRNVGQASTFTTGLMYILPFERRQAAP